MFLYAWLHMAGYELSIDDVKAFRQWQSKTPGHPEFGETPGVEATTGPLGQGVGNAVGLCGLSENGGGPFQYRRNTPSLIITSWCWQAMVALQEGIAQEASALAGHLQLDNLILIFDSNRVTLDAMAEVTQSEDNRQTLSSLWFRCGHR